MDGIVLLTLYLNIKCFTPKVSNLDDIQLEAYDLFETVTEKKGHCDGIN
jgi:hypothetical protein